MKIIIQPVLIIQLKFISQGISHIKNGCAIQGTNARNSNTRNTKNIMSIKIDQIQSFKGI